MDLVFVLQVEQGLGAPAKVASPELGKISSGSLKVTAVPAVIDDLFADFFGITRVFFRKDLIFPASSKNSGTLGEIIEDGGHTFF